MHKIKLFTYLIGKNIKVCQLILLARLGGNRHFDPFPVQMQTGTTSKERNLMISTFQKYKCIYSLAQQFYLSKSICKIDWQKYEKTYAQGFLLQQYL